MNPISRLRQLFFACAMILSFSSVAQESNKTKIIGTWYFYKFELINKASTKDSLEMAKESEGAIITFVDEKKYIAKQKVKGSIKIVEEGEYSMINNGKTMLQNDEKAEIVKLNDDELVLKIADQVIMYFKKGVLVD